MIGRRFLIAGLVPLFALALAAMPSAAQEWKTPVPGYEWSFPRDHANHGEYAVEWWYYTGHLLPVGADSTDPDAWVHIQLTFFRSAAGGPEVHPLYFAHLAMSGGATGDFDYAERIARGTLGEAGADEPVYHVWLDDWRASLIGKDQVLEAWDKEVGGFRLIATPEGEPVLNGDRGFSRKGPSATEASFYYSIPRMSATGYLLPPENEDASIPKPTNQSSSISQPERSDPQPRRGKLARHEVTGNIGSMFSSGNTSSSAPEPIA
ncbi:MAG: carotenoid 1,2-hydratase, partial [bacterium]